MSMEFAIFVMLITNFIITLAHIIFLYHNLAHKLLLMLISLILLLLSGCTSSQKQKVDMLNHKSYAFHYRNLDSAEYYANQALTLSLHDNEGQAEALNNLAFVATARMNYHVANALLNKAMKITDNQIELFVSDVQAMRLCQRQSRNKAFYTYRELALRRLHRIREEWKYLTKSQKRRFTYAETEFDIITSTYYYYVGLKRQSMEALKQIDPYGAIQQDTAQLLSYYYNLGTGNIIDKGSSEEIAQKEFDCLMRCYELARHNHYIFWEANAMQAISELLIDPSERKFLIRNNIPFIQHINIDNMPDSLLAGNLARRSLNMFLKFGDVYQIAGAYRTLAQCYWQIGDYKSARMCLDNALSDTIINRAPDLVSSIREQMSLVFAAIDDKAQSDYNRNIYLDLQEQTRQDKQLEARADQLNKSATLLNGMLIAVATMIVFVLFLLVVFDQMRRHRDKQFSIEQLLAPLEQWQVEEEKRLEQIDEALQVVEEQRVVAELHLSNNLRRNIEQRAKVALVNVITPLIDRILHEVYVLKHRQEKATDRAVRYTYIGELASKINEYNNVLTQWIQLKQGHLSLNIERFALQDLFTIVEKSSFSFKRKGIQLIIEPSTAIVKADKTLTLFMLNTLADNARKYTHMGGHVWISSKILEEENAVEIAIRDDGEGMSSEQVTHLFEHKIIVDESFPGKEQEDIEQSHGFGLMNCKGIIEKYRKISNIFSVCSLTVDSQLGKGSNFKFRLPQGLQRVLLLLSVLLGTISSWAGPHYLLKQAASFADSAYFSNLRGHYEKTLSYADSCRQSLNRYYLLSYPKAVDTLRYVGAEVVPAEINWFRQKVKIDYNIILDIRNETAVADLALHQWAAYHYNNRVYTQLFKETSADNSLGEYVRVMQRSENSKNVAIVLLFILLMSIFPAYYFLYYRYQLYYRLAVDRVGKINAVLSANLPIEEKLRTIDKLWNRANFLLKAPDSRLDEVVERIRVALKSSMASGQQKRIALELAEDELHRVEYECQQLHVSNNVLDNCLSTLKHETMYYPSRIKQLVDADEKDLVSINEVAHYYKQLYAILSQQAMLQIERNLKVTPELTKYLLSLIKKISHESHMHCHMIEKDEHYIVVEVELPALQLSADECALLFTPSSINIEFMVCRQIVREIGDATNLRACGIQARQRTTGGTLITITLPRRIKKIIEL